MQRFQFLPVMMMILVLASCSKTNKQGRLIPKDAAFVVHLNGQSLSSKLSWEEIKAGTFFQKINNDSNSTAFVKSVLADPGNSGIDVKNDLVFFVKKDSMGSVMAFEGTVKDAAKFKQFNIELSEGGSESERNGINFISKAPVCVGWSKEKFVYVIDAPHFNRQKNQNWLDTNYDTKRIPRDVISSCQAIFDLTEKNSLSSDEKFTALMKKNGDIHFWMNAEELNKGSKGIPGLSMLNLEKFYQGNITTATANFENGKIILDYKSYASEALKDLLKKYTGSHINENMIKNIPATDVAAVFAINFKPEGIRELVKALGIEGFANIGLALAGITLDDLVNANKGDIVLAITDIKSKKDSLPYTDMKGKENIITNDETRPDFLLAFSIADKTAFNKLAGALESLKKGAPVPASLFSYNSSDTYFVLGNSKETINKYLGGGNYNFDFINQLKDNPVGGYINLRYIIKAMETKVPKDSVSKAVYDASLTMWENIYIKGGQYKDGGVNYMVEINLMDKSTNSLKQLNQYLSKTGEIMYSIKEKRNNSTDILTIVPPVPDSIIQ